MAKDILCSIGLMSGTSLDGVDAAIVYTDGQKIEKLGEFLTHSYSDETQSRMHEMLGNNGDYMALEHELTLAHAHAVYEVLDKAGLEAKDVDVIGFHGQTVIHRPDEGITWQLGNPSLLAERTGISVVSDFRRRDMACGGQGAPFVPIFHEALVKEHTMPVAIVNIGGVANVTWVGEGDYNLIAFDTGPGNALVNDWVLQNSGELFDKDGELASKGDVDMDKLAELLAHPYFDKPAPKSLDRNSFDTDIIEGMSLEDGAATLTAFTVESIIKASERFPNPPKEWWITGGGRLNATIMNSLQRRLDAPVKLIEEVGFDGGAIEAQAFGYLAVRSIKGLPLSLPTTTGAKHPVTGGVFCRV